MFKINTQVFRRRLHFISFFPKESREMYRGFYEEWSCIMKAGTQGKAGLVKKLFCLFQNTEWTQALTRNFSSQIFADGHCYETCTPINLKLLSF